MKKLFVLVCAISMLITINGCKDKKEPSLKEKQSKECRSMIEKKSKMLVKTGKLRNNTKVIEYKSISYHDKGKYNVMLSEAYIDFDGANQFRGRWACVFKSGTTDGVIQMVSFKGSNGKWKPASK
jgi:hypothetical protein